jgi:hypothetical protein
MVAIAEQNGKPGDIYRLIPEIMRRVGGIGKGRTATNASGKAMYSFRGIDDVYNACQPHMAELGVFIVPEVIEKEYSERESRGGGTLFYTRLLVKHTFYAADGSFVVATTVGEAMDSGDKSANKAMSTAMKYACIETFSIPTAEDNDTENQTHQVTRQQQRPPQRPPQRQVAPPRNMNPATGEVPANGAEKTVAVDPAAFAEYGDVMDDERFQEAVLNEMKKRSFTDKACIDAQASACRAE